MEYVYDIKYGHYLPLNEDENATVSGNEDKTTEETQNEETTTNSGLANLESDDVQKVRQEKMNKARTVQEKINQKNSNIIQLQTSLNAAEQKKDQNTINTLQRQILQAKKDLLDAKFELEKTNYDCETKILQLQTALIESAISQTFPEKYKNLNEQMLNDSKIYLDTIFNGSQIVNEMSDYKNIMKNADMLYGKDDIGYFAVCLDQYDLNKLQYVLESAGFKRDIIMSCYLSQLY